VTPPGDERDRLQREHGVYLHGLARKLCRSQLDPEALVKEVLERQRGSALAAGDGERARLARAVYELFLDRLRYRQARQHVLDETVEFVTAASGEQTWWQGLTAAEVRAEIARLPDEPRAAFELIVREGASYRDIAARLGIARGVVVERILRARRKLRERLAKGRDEG